MTPFPPEVTSAATDLPIGMIFRLTGLAPAAAAALLVAMLFAVYGLVRFDCRSRLPEPH
jgi:hypothetical protein